jgi:hypothetical protein
MTGLSVRQCFPCAGQGWRRLIPGCFGSARCCGGGWRRPRSGRKLRGSLRHLSCEEFDGHHSEVRRAQWIPAGSGHVLGNSTTATSDGRELGRSIPGTSWVPSLAAQPNPKVHISRRLCPPNHPHLNETNSGVESCGFISFWTPRIDIAPLFICMFP